MKKYNSAIYLLLYLLLITSYTAPAYSADLVLTAPPRENLQRGNELYGQIAEKLGQVIGKRIVYEHPKNWAEYANKMRSGHYDIMFDGPHFVAWRQKNLKHRPVVSLPGTLQFHIVTHKNNDAIKKERDLIGKKICGMPSPHLATDLVYDIFKNPVLQPTIYEVKGGQKKSFQAFKEGKCVATIFRTTLYKRLPDKVKKNLKIVTTTRKLPNQTISISQRLHKNSKLIANFLVSKDGALAADELLTRYSRRKKQFIKASPKKFVGAADILEGIVWGW